MALPPLAAKVLYGAVRLCVILITGKERYFTEAKLLKMQNQPSEATVAEALERILASPAFRNSRQCQKFLRYVVEHSHAGAEDRLKERTIGAELFGREPDYDTADDPVVRVRATEVRKRLSQYYGESTREEEVRFEIPAGSYRAEIHWNPGRPSSTPALPTTAPGGGISGTWLVAGILGLIALAVGGLLLVRKPAPTLLEQFWLPVLSSPKPALLYCGQPVVYFLAPDLRSKYPAGQPANLPPDLPLKGSDVIPVTDQFVGIGNAHTAALLNGLFATRRKAVEIRYANDVSFSDLRSSPAVLIGAFSNLWTLEMSAKLRFVFEQDGGGRRIRDTKDNRTWQLDRLAPDGKTPQDYALVSRLFDSATGQFLVIAGGITQYGTRAAGEFLTEEPLLRAALGREAWGWDRKNVQVLLETAVYKGTPAPPKVIATYVW